MLHNAVSFASDIVTEIDVASLYDGACVGI